MSESVLLPGERRRPTASPSVEEAATPSRSVRSIRARFEAQPTAAAVPQATASAPTTPAKKRPSKPKPRRPTPATTTKVELAAFLNDRSSNPSATTTSPPSPPSAPHVGSLIEKWSTTTVPTARARPPLAERHIQRPTANPNHPPPPPPPPPMAYAPPESVDTFGSSADFDRIIPKTDPGRLESYAAHARLAAALPSDIYPASGDQSLRELATRGLQRSNSCVNRAARDEGPSLDLPRTPPLTREEPAVHPHRPELRDHLMNVTEKVHTPLIATPVEVMTTPVTGAGMEFEAGDLYIHQLFAQAEDTAERAVQFDEDDDYFKAFELYSVVVDLYYKVIPFLTPEQGVDVHERIKMYTRRCTTIQQAFEFPDSSPVTPAGDIGEAAEAAPVITDQMVPPQLVWSSPQPPVESNNDKMPAAAMPMDVQAAAIPIAPPAPTATELHRTPYPDYARDVLPDGPPAGDEGRRMRDRGEVDAPPINGHATPALSASTQAHRDSLNRPISRSKVRASTNSISREKVAEMQERVNLMQECLNNFTVKRKHLGPARALELAVTTLNANTFGDLKKLEPLPANLEHKWATELEVLMSMLKEVKEVRPGVGHALREDIAKHLPSLEKCDRSVRETVRSFAALNGHVRYVDRETAGDAASGGGRGQQRWWIKVPVVDRGGLRPDVFRIVEEAEKEMRVVFKVCRAINVDVVKSIPVPPSFVEGLPKHARALISRELKEGLTTWGMFKVSDYMKDRNLWNKKDAKEITSNLEKVALIWEARTSNKSFLSRTFDIRGERFHQAMTAFRRCQNAIRDLRRDWPTMTQTELDMAKIQHNQDIGLAGLEAYSRALESRAYRLLTRIRELLDADEREKRGVGEGAIVPVRRT